MSEPDSCIVILGASGHGRVIQAIAAARGLTVAGFYDDDAGSFRDSGRYLGTFAELLKQEDTVPGILGIGDNRVRREVVERMGNLPYTGLVHPSVVVAADVEIGEGTVVMAGAIINPGCRIGRHCVINTGAILEHDSVMADFSSLGPRAVVGGGVQIGEESFIGIGATVSHGLSIGTASLVGAGAVVVRNLPERVVAMGVPASVRRAREPGERYL